MRLKSLLLLSVLVTVAILPARAVPPAAPTAVRAYAPNQNRVHVSWVDNATDETGYKVERRVDSGAWENLTLTPLPADFEVFRWTAVSSAEQTYKFRITAVKGAEESTATESQALVKPSGALDLFNDITRTEPGSLTEPFEIPEGSSARAGSSVSLQIRAYSGTPTSYEASDLAPGLSLSESTGLITGTVAEPGVYRMFIGVVFNTSKRFEQVRFLRVLPGVSTPVVNTPLVLPKQDLGVAGFIDISTLFKDPKREKGAWFFLAGESFIVALHDTATPKTVRNFLGYVARRDYDSSYIHRNIGGFIFQGGGYTPATTGAAPTAWKEVTARHPVQNEPGISNTPYTIAFAKRKQLLSGEPGTPRDSATAEWFFNVGALNPGNLDFQNGGFTAFGEVVGTGGRGLVNGVNNLATKNYNAVITGPAGDAFSDVPVLETKAPTPPGPNTLLRIDSITPCPPLAIDIAETTNPNVLTALVEGMLLYIESKGVVGTSNLTLRATNLDGNTVDFVLPITIEDFTGPGVSLTKLRGSRPVGSLIVKGRASDDVELGRWRYRVNRGKWVNGGVLSGKSAVITKKMRGFRRGKNVIEIEVFDKKGNTSGILKQTFTLG
jgi:cyclophilin family peptidyl-prolyl cis-trans isomerase